MQNHRWLLCGVVLATMLLVVGSAFGQQSERKSRRILWVPGEIYPGPDAASRLPGPGLRGGSTAIQAASRLVLEDKALAAPEPSLSSGEGASAPLHLGVHRQISGLQAGQVAPSRLRWRPVAAGGAVGTLVVVSPGAAGVRVAIEFSALPAGSEVRFADPDSGDTVAKPLTADFLTPRGAAAKTADQRAESDLMDPGEPLWSPVVVGDAVAVEIWIPDIDLRTAVEYRLVEVSHLFDLPPGRMAKLRASAGCYLNTACRPRTSPLMNAVAWEVFEDDGGTYGCTGQLLTDTNPRTFKPYYATAAHCFDTPEAAQTATFAWFFQRENCDDPRSGVWPEGVVQTVGGGRLLATTGNPFYHRHSPDFTFLRLRQPPPAGVAFSGWTNQRSARLVGRRRVDLISHPEGLDKQVTVGVIDREVQYRYIVPGNLTSVLEPPFTHYYIRHLSGQAGPGSSGGGLWIGRKWPNQYLIGVMWGGANACPAADPGSVMQAGEFDLAYRDIRKWLDPRGQRE